MGVFGVWYGKCAKYLAFGTFTTPAVDALMLHFQLVSFFFFFSKVSFVDFLTINSTFVHYLWTYKHHFSVTFSLKIGHTVLFTHLKIILLQYFQFSIFAK